MEVIIVYNELVSNLVDIFTGLVAQYPSWTYAILGIGTLLQGEAAILFSMYLLINKVITLGGFLGATLSGLIIGETFIYILGRATRNTRFGWKFYYKKKANKKLQLYTYYLKRNMIKLFIITKFIPGTNLLIFLLTGWSRVKFGSFMKAYLASVFVWFSTMTLIAYSIMSGITYLRTEKIFKQAEIGIIVFILIIIFGERFLRKYFDKKALQFEPKEDMFEKEYTEE